jgi:N-ethylmaleimide reductase
VRAVHAKNGFVFAQLWHNGRSSHSDNQDGNTPVSASVDPSYWEDPNHLVSAPDGWVQSSPHRALDISEIPGIVEDYRKAAVRAKAAGFDGVELHAGNGYLPDQFLQDGSNKRTDSYGGSIENRSRFLLEVVEAMTSVWGGDRVASHPPAPGTTCAIAILQLYYIRRGAVEPIRPCLPSHHRATCKRKRDHR